ncbi:MAG: lipocalin family protein [Gelidibacter sp.]
MKTHFKTFSIVLIVLTLGITSCSKDDGPPPPTTAELLAHKWFVVKVEELTTAPPTVYVADACGQNSYFDFQPNGNFKLKFFGLDMGNCEVDFEATANYVLSDDETEIIFSDGMSTVTWPIETLTETELVLIAQDGNIKYFSER